jgi:hypothetical protein
MFVRYGKIEHCCASSVTGSQLPKYYVMPQLSEYGHLRNGRRHSLV